MSHGETKDSIYCSLQQKTGPLTTKDNQSIHSNLMLTCGIHSYPSTIHENFNFGGQLTGTTFLSLLIIV